MPAQLEIVPQSLLQQLAGSAPPPPAPSNQQPNGHVGSFDLVTWIAEYNLQVDGPTPWQGGQRWVFPVCPMNESHTNRSAFIMQMASGAIAAGCQHQSCQWNWHGLRDRVEPGWRTRPARAATANNEVHIPVAETHWPAPVDPAAFHGLAGDFVRAVEPHSEADPVALLIQFMVGFGNAIGRRAHFRAESDQHYLNLFCVLVGRTSKGRKGTSWGRVKRVMEQVDPQWASSRIVTGLSSGEGLIWEVRDPIVQQKSRQREGQTETYEAQVDAGVADKRLTVLESEFARTLRVMSRESNTLSAIIRQAWDTGDLRAMTKNSPARATGGHISIIGHVTKDELTRELSVTDTANGFGNRFLWLAVERSKCLPEGGRLDQVDLEPLVHQLRAAVQVGQTTGEMYRDEEATAIWREVYPSLSDGRPGMYGAMTSRAEAQVMRLACIYALLDLSRVVRAEHLMAALALWEYVERSVAYVFGDAIGDPDADLILHALRCKPEGMTRTEIRDLFGRHNSAAEIARTLGTLLEHELARREEQDTGGRPTERWYAADRCSQGS
jgi:hypothetical protein